MLYKITHRCEKVERAWEKATPLLLLPKLMSKLLFLPLMLTLASMQLCHNLHLERKAPFTISISLQNLAPTSARL